MDTLSTFCAEARERAGLTQAQLSKQMGYTSPQFISNIERGISAFPVVNAKAFIKATKCSPGELFNAVLSRYGSRIGKYFPTPKTRTKKK